MEVFSIGESSIRVIGVGSGYMYVLADVCRMVGIDNVSRTASRLSREHVTLVPVGGIQTNVITWHALLEILFTSRSGAAKQISATLSSKLENIMLTQTKQPLRLASSSGTDHVLLMQSINDYARSKFMDVFFNIDDLRFEMRPETATKPALSLGLDRIKKENWHTVYHPKNIGGIYTWHNLFITQSAIVAAIAPVAPETALAILHGENCIGYAGKMRGLPNPDKTESRVYAIPIKKGLSRMAAPQWGAQSHKQH